MIRQISIIPFDLGGSPDVAASSAALLAAGYAEDKLGTFLPRQWLHFRTHDSACRILIHPAGFGCVVVSPSEFEGEVTDQMVGNALVARRRVHCSMIQGNHALCAEILRIRYLVSKSGKFRSRARLFWETCPYVLSLFCVQIGAIGQKLTGLQKRRLAALVEPSIVFGEDQPGDRHDSTAEAIARRMPTVSAKCCEQLLVDYDLSEESAVHISWAGVVVVSDNMDLLESVSEEVVALEARLQIGWTMLHYVNKWKHVALDAAKPIKDAFELRWQMARMIETTEDLVDASVPTRLKNIYSELISSSGFEDEKRKAERGLTAATEYANILSERAEHKYRIVVEILLFLFGFCQVIPLVFEVPLVRFPIWTLWPTIIAAVVLIALRYARLRQ